MISTSTGNKNKAQNAKEVNAKNKPTQKTSQNLKQVKRKTSYNRKTQKIVNT